jgi:hypothetical protein
MPRGVISPLTESALHTSQSFVRDGGAPARVQEHYNVVKYNSQLSAILETRNKMCFRVWELPEGNITEVDGLSAVWGPHVVFGRVVNCEYLKLE